MRERDNDFEQEEIFSKFLRAGRRTYFFDVRSTKAGDYYLTITESKKFSQEQTGNAEYKKHKIFLYKEDFDGFKDILNEVTDFIIKERGAEVLSERHRTDYNDNFNDREHSEDSPANKQDSSVFTNLEFEDII